MNRRNFLKVAGVATGTALSVRPAGAAAKADPGAQRGVLVDLTRCIGCRTCEESCAAANELPDPDWSDDMSYDRPRQLTEKQWTVVNRHMTRKGEVFVKSQCMHCLTPACAAGCLTKGLEKQPEGAVTWDGDKCMGCRYCMVACPFDAPKFEYAGWNPKIQKCQLCFERTQAGGVPACVENCPAEALTFGTRDHLLRIARQRIHDDPQAYHDHVYGEHEVGGTSYMYISPVPFEDVGFPTDLGTTAIPETTRDFLTAVPLVLIGLPAMLLALRKAQVSKEEDAEVAELVPAPVVAGGKES